MNRLNARQALFAFFEIAGGTLLFAALVTTPPWWVGLIVCLLGWLGRIAPE